MRETILAIVAKYHGVSADTITEQTPLNSKGLWILADISARLRMSVNIPDLSTATVGDLFKGCGLN